VSARVAPLVLLAAGAGCGLMPDGPAPCPVVTQRFETAANPMLDVLFVIDNSPAMASAPLQAKLMDRTTGLPALVEGLKKVPLQGFGTEGGTTALPDIHIAVVSSNTGAGAFDLPDRGCPHFGDEGRFQSAPRAPCAVPPLPPDQHYLEAHNNQGQRNYDGDITDAFACIAALGSGGCGFQGALQSVRWALDPNAAPPENAGFLRDDAALAVFLISNEDDCSLPDDSTLADPTQELMSDPLGPPSFRCHEFGHLCDVDGSGGLRPPPRAAADSLSGCVSNDSPTGKLTRVADEVAFLKSLKADPNQIFVAAITGPEAPYSIRMVPRTLSSGAVEDQPEVQPSCTGPTGELARPSIRIRQWVQGFGSHGLLLPICASNFMPAVAQFMSTLAILRPVCIDGTLRLRASGVPDCTVTQRSSYTPGTVGTAIPVPACAENGGNRPCWSLEDEPATCVGSKRFLLHRLATDAPLFELTDLSCVLASADATCSAPGR